jgi:HemY protein
MRKIFAYSLIGLLLGVAVVALIEIDPGYVLVAYGRYTLETSLWVGTLVLLLFTMVVYLLVRLVGKILGGRTTLSGWFGSRRARQGVHLTNRGLISFIEGNWSKSRQLLLRGAKAGEAPLLNYLLSARASEALGETDKMHEYFVAAQGSETDAGIAVELVQAEMKLAAQQYQESLASLESARRNAGRHPRVLSLLCKVYEGLEDWQSLADLLPELKKNKVLPAGELPALEKTIYRNLFQSGVVGDEADKVRKRWNQLPKEMKAEPALVHDYLEMLIGFGEHDEAGKLILKHLKRDWDSTLVRLYGLSTGTNSAGQLSHAESWLAQHSEDVQLQLCLGRLAARCQLWGKSRDYFENSYKLEHSAEVCAELGRLLAALGEDKISAAYYREGLMLKESALPELPMPDKAVSRVKRLANS